MPKLTAENTLQLPEERTYQAPTDGDELWFKQERPAITFEIDCLNAIIAKGIGANECPTPREWAAFAIAGAVIAALTGKYIVPPTPKTAPWAADLEQFIWEAFWPAAQENGAKLDRTLLAVVLRQFLPRFRSGAPYFSSGYASHFEEHWREYPDTHFSSISNVRQMYLRKGHTAFRELPKDVQRSIRKIVKHVPTMLRITNDWVRANYHW